MFTEESIKIFYNKYVSAPNSYKKRVRELNTKISKDLKTFLHKYSYNNFLKLSIYEYAFEQGNRNTFCYWMDNTLNKYGDLHINHVGGYTKFHIQFKKGSNKPIIFKNNQHHTRLGDNANDIYKKIQQEIPALIKAAENEQYDVLEKSLIYRPFACKIYYVYNTNASVPIYVDNDVTKILDILQINYPQTTSFHDKRKMLFEYYKELNVLLGISTRDFMDFLYAEEGFRDLLRESKTAQTFAAYKDDDPFLKLIGDKAEKIVADYFKRNKKRLGIVEIKTPGLDRDDSKHYDIYLKYKNNKEEYIEVKCSYNKHYPKSKFFLSQDEYDFMINNRSNYFLYYIDNVKENKKFKIFKPNSLLVDLRPCKYKYEN